MTSPAAIAAADRIEKSILAATYPDFNTNLTANQGMEERVVECQFPSNRLWGRELEGKVSLGLIAFFASLVAMFFLPVASFALTLILGNSHLGQQLQVTL